MDNSFSREVDAAMNEATKSSDFVLSLAEREVALSALVRRLVAMDRSAAIEYIRQTFRGAGTWDALAVAMFKRAIA